MSTNRGGDSLISTHLTLKQGNMKEKEYACWRREIYVVFFGVYLILVGIGLGDKIYTKEVVGFSPLWFPGINICVIFMLLYFIYSSDPIPYGYDVMMLNV